MNIKRIALIIVFWGFFVSPFLVSVPQVEALTTEEILAQIKALQEQIAQLQKQLGGTGGEGELVWCYDFEVNLRYGDTGNDVKALQIALEKEGFRDAKKDYDTGVFGIYTSSAVVGFQEKYIHDILAPYGLKRGTGFVGRTTRAKLNAIYSCDGITSGEKPEITIVSPNGGEKWAIDNTYEVKFSCIKEISEVYMELYDYNYNSVGKKQLVEGPSEISCIPGIVNTYSWKIRAVILDPGNYFKIKIRTSDGSMFDESDNYFSIIKKTTALWSWDYCTASSPCSAGEGDCDVDADCNTSYCAQDVGTKYGQVSTMDVCEEKLGESITITSPNGGEQLEIGQTYDITWKSTGIETVDIALLHYSSPTARGVPYTIAQRTLATPGKFSWKVSSEINEKYWIGDSNKISLIGYATVSGVEKSFTDQSDSYFSIIAEATITETIRTYEINPYDADVKTCTNSRGKVFSTTGEDSASWFVWNGCTRNKYYNVNPGEKLTLNTRTDSCPGCVCYYPNFYVYEYENGKWVYKKYFNLPDVKGVTKDVYYTPSSNKIKIYAPRCFYLNVYSPNPVVVEESITVTSPNGGERWAIGETHDILWEASGVETIYARIIHGEDKKGVEIISGISGSLGKYSWTIGQEIMSSRDDYQISIFGENTLGQVISDKSDNYFSIVAEKSITVTSPNGNEALFQGSEYTIKWNAFNLPDDAKIHITLFQSGETNIPIVSNLPSTQREYVWKVSTVGDWAYGCEYKPSLFAKILGIKEVEAAGPSYKIMVSASWGTYGNVYDKSDGWFLIWANPSCTDSDSGKDYYVKGSTTGIHSSDSTETMTDFCRTNTNPTTDSCSAGQDDCRVVEFFCGELLSNTNSAYFNGYTYFVEKSCAYGCSDGACLTEATTTTCHTSDLWSWNYCSIDCKCDAGEGDCDTNSDCNTGYCAQDVGTKYGQVSTMDVCEERTAKSISVTSPNGGEQWTIGETYDISWSSTGVDKINIEIQDGSTGWHLAYGVLASTGKYSWTVPSTQPISSSYKMLIAESSPGSNIQDKSDSYFSIVEAVTACTDSDEGKDYYVKGTVMASDGTMIDQCESKEGYDKNRLFEAYCCDGKICHEVYVCPYGCKDGACQPGITVTSPNGGEQWIEGQTYNITWETQGISQVGIELQDYTTSFFAGIASKIDATQKSYSWKVPDNFFSLTYGLEPGDDYKIRIFEQKSDGARGLEDESDNYFSIVQAGSLSISLAPDTPMAQNVVNGNTNITFLRAKFTVSNVEDIRINRITVHPYKSGTIDLASPTDITNLKLYDGSTQIGSTQQLNQYNYAIFSNLAWTIPKGTSETLTVKADIPTTVTATSLKTTIYGGVVMEAVGVTSGASIQGLLQAEGNWMTIVSSVLTVSLAADTPSSTILVMGNNITFAKLDFAAHYEEIHIKQITIKRMGGSDTNFDAIRLYVYENDLLVQIGSDGYLLDGRTTFAFPLGSYLVVPKDDFKSVIIKADVRNLSSETTEAIQLCLASDGINYELEAQGVVSSTAIKISGNTHFCGSIMVASETTGGLKGIEDQLASVSEAIARLLEDIQELMKR